MAAGYREFLGQKAYGIVIFFEGHRACGVLAPDCSSDLPNQRRPVALIAFSR